MDDEELLQALEAMIFSSRGPVSSKRLAASAGVEIKRVRKMLAALRSRLHEEGRGWQIREIAGGWQFFSNPECAGFVRTLHKPPRDARLSQAALDTLTIIAYRQPVTRADIESIRGVAAGPVIKALIEKDLVRIVGRAEVAGRPLLYGTTKKFLGRFGLKSVDDLPRPDDLSMR